MVCGELIHKMGRTELNREEQVARPRTQYLGGKATVPGVIYSSSSFH